MPKIPQDAGKFRVSGTRDIVLYIHLFNLMRSWSICLGHGFSWWNARNNPNLELALPKILPKIFQTVTTSYEKVHSLLSENRFGPWGGKREKERNSIAGSRFGWQQKKKYPIDCEISHEAHEELLLSSGCENCEVALPVSNNWRKLPNIYWSNEIRTKLIDTLSANPCFVGQSRE